MPNEVGNLWGKFCVGSSCVAGAETEYVRHLYQPWFVSACVCLKAIVARVFAVLM